MVLNGSVKIKHSSANMDVQLVYVFLQMVLAAALAEDVAVDTKVGTFVGFRDVMDIGGNKVSFSKFLGIPYAEPPVGDLRFRKPVPKSPLKEPLHVKKFGNRCHQAMFLPNAQVGSEDCLFLNIYSPVGTTPGVDKLPVMIWIHGGGFQVGSSNDYPPNRLAANGPVIIVTINYRLFVWGFLSTDDSSSPGNYGLWDQHLAIKWVHDNIGAFGGDPNAVTIFGESAGGACVIFQGWYPGNKGLFQRIIAQSGSSLAFWATSPAPLSDTKHLASLTGCADENTEKMVDCLRGIDNSIINATVNDVSNGFSTRLCTFYPSLDNDFVPKCPAADIKKYSTCTSAFASYDLMIGITSGEGYLLVPPSFTRFEEQFKFYPNRTFVDNVLIPAFIGIIAGQCDELVETVVHEYTAWNDPENPEAIREHYCDFMKDLFFLESTWRTVDVHARFAARPASYLYEVTAKPSTHALPTPQWATKPNHADDLVYVFGGESKFTEWGRTEETPLLDSEKELSDQVMTLWTNFAKTGNPNKPRDFGFDWLPYTHSHQHYFHISEKLSPLSVKTHLEGRRIDFWTKKVPAIIKRCKEKQASNIGGTCEKDGGCSP